MRGETVARLEAKKQNEMSDSHITSAKTYVDELIHGVGVLNSPCSGSEKVPFLIDKCLSAQLSHLHFRDGSFFFFSATCARSLQYTPRW